MRQILSFTSLLTALSAMTLANGIVFCKMDHVPHIGWERNTDCIQIYDWDLDGCYLTHEGFAKKGQSWLVTEGNGFCRTYTDTGCKKTYEPAEDWGLWRDKLGTNFASFKCIKGPY